MGIEKKAKGLYSKIFREKGDTKGTDTIYKIFGSKRNAHFHFYAYLLINFIFALAFILNHELLITIASFIYLTGCILLLSSLIYRYYRYKKLNKSWSIPIQECVSCLVDSKNYWFIFSVLAVTENFINITFAMMILIGRYGPVTTKVFFVKSNQIYFAGVFPWNYHILIGYRS